MLPFKTLRWFFVVPILLFVKCDAVTQQGQQFEIRRYENYRPNEKIHGLPPGEILARNAYTYDRDQTSGRLRRQLLPIVHGTFNSFLQSMSEGAKVVKHVIVQPFRGNRHKRLHNSSHKHNNQHKPHQHDEKHTDTYSEKHYHYDDHGKRIPDPQLKQTKHSSEVSYKPYKQAEYTSHKILPDKILRQIEKQEEEKMEAASGGKNSYKKYPSSYENTYMDEDGWIPLRQIESYPDYKHEMQYSTESSKPVGKLHTSAMDQPIGVQVHLKQQIVSVGEIPDYVHQKESDQNHHLSHVTQSKPENYNKEASNTKSIVVTLSPRKRKNTKISTFTTTTERPNYPEYFFDLKYNDTDSPKSSNHFKDGRLSRTKINQQYQINNNQDELFKGSFSHYPTPPKFNPIPEYSDSNVNKTGFSTKENKSNNAKKPTKNKGSDTDFSITEEKGRSNTRTTTSITPQKSLLFPTEITITPTPESATTNRQSPRKPRYRPRIRNQFGDSNNSGSSNFEITTNRGTVKYGDRGRDGDKS